MTTLAVKVWPEQVQFTVSVKSYPGSDVKEFAIGGVLSGDALRAFFYSLNTAMVADRFGPKAEQQVIRERYRELIEHAIRSVARQAAHQLASQIVGLDPDDRSGM